MPGVAFQAGALSKSCQRGAQSLFSPHDHRENLPAPRRRGAHLSGLGSRAGVSLRAAGAAQCRAVHHRHPAAERHRLAAHGPRAQQHAAGYSLPLRAHARARRAVAAGHRSRRHRDADGGRAADDGAAGAGPPRHRAREVSREGLGLEGGVRRHHHQPAQAARSVVRLVARPLHHGRRAFAGRAQGLRRPLPAGPDLQGQAAGQLGPEPAHRDLGSRGAAGRGEGLAVAHQISDRRR